MKRRHRGFSLQEMVISVGILAVTAMLMLNIYVGNNVLEEKSAELDKAIVLSKNIVELISAGERISPESKFDILRAMRSSGDGRYIIHLDKAMNFVDGDDGEYSIVVDLKDSDIAGVKDIHIDTFRKRNYLNKPFDKGPFEVFSLESSKFIRNL